MANIIDKLNSEKKEYLRKRAALLESMKENYIIDRICEQKSPIFITNEEDQIVTSVVIDFCLEQISELIKDRDRNRLIAALENLQDIPEIKQSDTLGYHIDITIRMLKLNIDFDEAVERIREDWMLIRRHCSICTEQVS